MLLSGGLDSTTTLAIAQREGFEVYALSFHYGQRHEWNWPRLRGSMSTFGVAQHVTRRWRLCANSADRLTADIAVPKSRSQRRNECSHDPRHLRAGAQHRLSVIRARLGGGAGCIRTIFSA